MSEMPAKRTGFRAWWPFPGIVFALLGMSTTLVVTTLILATNDPSFGLEEDYFAKGVAWDDTAIQMETNRTLGWDADVELAVQLDGRGDRAVTVLLTDSQGASVEGAAVEAFGFHNARRKETFSFALTEIAPGRYSAGEPLEREGRWTLRLRFVRGGDVFTTSVDAWTN